MQKVSPYLSLVKFSHTVFALPFAVIGFFLAITYNHLLFDGFLFLKVLLCMVFARSAAMAFNRYIDRNFDGNNPRTANREIPSGMIKPQSALLFITINSFLFIATCFFINPLCLFLSPIALIVILGYSYTKRFTSLCHLVLGLGLSLAPIGAYLSVTGKFAVLPILFSIAVFFWVSGFDIIYALQDEDFDKKSRLNSIPAYLGKKNALNLSKLLHCLAVFFIFFAGFKGEFSMLYWIGSLIFTSLLIYQHTLVKVNDLQRVNLAFFTTNGIGSIVFGLFVVFELLGR